MHKIVIFMLMAFCAAAPVLAQGEIFTWKPYDFSVTLPEGWQAAENSERLVLGTPDDVAHVLDGQLGKGIVVVVQVVQPDADPETTLENYAPFSRLTIESIRYGIRSWPTITDIPVIAGRQSRLILVEETFLITASAPDEGNADFRQIAYQSGDFERTLGRLVAGIRAQTVEFAPAETLVQRIAWHDLSFAAPHNWNLYYGGSRLLYLVTSQRNRLVIGRSFQQHDLALELLDLSHMRSLLSPDSLPFLRGMWYVPEHYTIGDIAEAERGGVTIASADFENETEQGQALLLLTPAKAYLVVGIAGKTQWQAGESALFDSIRATIRLETSQ